MTGPLTPRELIERLEAQGEHELAEAMRRRHLQGTTKEKPAKEAALKKDRRP